MEPSFSALGLKALAPAILSGYRALRHELARRFGEEGFAQGLAGIDDILDEAVAVLARNPESLWQAVQVEAKGFVSRPPLFDEPAPRAWIRTAEAQRCLKLAARAAVRGDDDAPHAAGAVAHYQFFLNEAAETAPPDAGQVYVAALDYLLISLHRAMSLGERVILGAIAGMRGQL
ncbi:MAG TPA: hypothetical protein VM915_14055, partial [Verrucomicrobiae bacterium]|nr:hypothetical protein [Verrucomicrobiae bacterium]